VNDREILEISRRIEREAGSVYRINGRDVRARDVQILFADAATGARSPALVHQGKIGEIIQAKPEQRRRVLEDAAGVAGLHARRHEAELRLKAAETNLTRVEDVIGQLAAQIDGLKKQARQAIRYREVAAKVRKAEAMLFPLAAGWKPIPTWRKPGMSIGAPLPPGREAARPRSTKSPMPARSASQPRLSFFSSFANRRVVAQRVQHRADLQLPQRPILLRVRLLQQGKRAVAVARSACSAASMPGRTASRRGVPTSSRPAAARPGARRLPTRPTRAASRAPSRRPRRRRSRRALPGSFPLRRRRKPRSRAPSRIPGRDPASGGTPRSTAGSRG